MCSYLENEKHEAKLEGKHEANIKTAKRLLKMKKLSFKEIAVGSGLSVEEVQKLVSEL